MVLRSSIEPATWPAVLTGKSATLLAGQQQLDESQWWSPAEMRVRQFALLQPLVEFAAQSLPFYAERLQTAGWQPGMALTEALWAAVPVLTRDQARDAGERLHAPVLPASHGRSGFVTSGGSTGIPVRVYKSELAQTMWEMLHVREKLWAGDDLHGTLVRISTGQGLAPELVAQLESPEGFVTPNWGGLDDTLWHTGTFGWLADRHPLAVQAAFLQRLEANYLFTVPATLRLLLAYFRNTGTRLPSLRSVWVMSEMVDDGLRQACQEVFGCEIIANYSAAEVGFIGLQCPLHRHYHVQSEMNLVEILDPSNRPCAVGEAGRVVVTPLHNYATPLLRYEVGDLAELGEPCPCGRGLPVLARISGRIGDYVVSASGQRRRFNPDHYALAKIPAVVEFQFRQRSLERIELALVISRPLQPAELGTIQGLCADFFGPEFQIDITFHTILPRTPAGKLLPFVSDLPRAGAV